MHLQMPLNLNMYTSYYTLNIVHCTPHVHTAICNFITWYCKHPKFAWVGLKIYMAKCTLIYPNIFGYPRVDQTNIQIYAEGGRAKNMDTFIIYRQFYSNNHYIFLKSPVFFWLFLHIFAKSSWQGTQSAVRKKRPSYIISQSKKLSQN